MVKKQEILISLSPIGVDCNVGLRGELNLDKRFG